MSVEEILAFACDAPEDTVGVSILYTPGQPLVLAASVEVKDVYVILDLAKYEVMHHIRPS